jgi:hypothetical protein
MPCRSRSIPGVGDGARAGAGSGSASVEAGASDQSGLGVPLPDEQLELARLAERGGLECRDSKEVAGHVARRRGRSVEISPRARATSELQRVEDPNVATAGR